MKASLVSPEVCSGMYYPLSGQPQHGYYVVVEEFVLDGPFKTKREATKRLTELGRGADKDTETPQSELQQPRSPYDRTLETVLRQQEKALTATMGARR